MFLAGFGFTAAQAQNAAGTADVKQTSGLLTVSGKTSGTFTREEIVDSKGLEFIPEGTAGMKVTGYKLNIQKSGEEPFIIAANGDGTITDLMKINLKGAGSGTRITFENITYTDKKGAVLKHASLTFTIKE